MEYVSDVRRVLGCVLGLTLALALAACNSDDEEDAAPRPRATVPTTTSTTATADPYAIPDTIDVAYVQRVIDRLNEAEGGATREFVAARELVPAGTEILRWLYATDELNRVLQSWSEVANAAAFDAFRQPPGNLRSTVKRVISATPSCVFAEIEEDPSAVVVAPTVATTYIALVPKPSDRRGSSVNPTPWIISSDLVSENGGTPRDPCVP